MDERDVQAQPLPSVRELRRWYFGVAVLDESRQELMVGGHLVPLTMKPMAVLSYLLRHAGELVTKEDLQAAAWPRRILSDTVLSKTLSRLRTGLGNDAIIDTVRGRGYRLTAQVESELVMPTPPREVRSAATRAERRQLSILFCSWVGAEQLAEQVDLESYHETLLAYYDCASRKVQRYQGHIAQMSSDGILVYFGYPLARDEDALRTVRCGLELLDAFARLRVLHRLKVRAGVHTGMVIIGSVDGNTHGGAIALGQAGYLARRISAGAEPGKLNLSEATLQRVANAFSVTAVPAADVHRGKLQLSVYAVQHVHALRDRLAMAENLTPFVGRETEQALLLNLWGQSQGDQVPGQAVLLRGEPGVGKSSLLQRLRHAVDKNGARVLEIHGHALVQDSPYRPIVEWLQTQLQFSATDPAELRLRQLEAGLDAVSEDRYQAIPLLAAFFGLQPNAQYPLSQMAPESRQEKTQVLLSRWLLALAQKQAVLLVVEDLQWLDAGTLAVLTQLLEALPGHRMLVAMTARLRFVPPWQMLHLSILTLPVLAEDQVNEMLSNLLDQQPLSERLRCFIWRRSSGVPLFVEELVRHGQEAERFKLVDGRLDLPPGEQADIPASLQALLTARLDRLGDARHCAQVAAAIGVQAPYALLQRVTGVDTSVLQAQLQRLVDAGLLYPHANEPDGSYRFKHELVRDAAYDSLLLKDRRRLHATIACVLERQFPESAGQEPAVLARHFELADDMVKAVQYFAAASAMSLARGDAAQAVAHTEHALALLATLPAGADRAHAEMRLLLLLHLCQLMLLGMGHPITSQVLTRADNLRPLVQDPMLQSQALANLAQHHLSRGELNQGLGFAKKLQALGQSTGSPVIQAVGGIASGWMHWMLGNLQHAWELLEATLTVLPQADPMQVTSLIGSDGRTIAMVPMPILAWLLGSPSKACELQQQTLAAAQASGNLYSICLAASFDGILLPLMLRQPAGIGEVSMQLEEITRHQGLPGWEPFAKVHRGLSLAGAGLLGEARPILDEALAAQEAIGSRLALPILYGLQAQLYLAAGRLEDAERVLMRAQKAHRAYATRLWEAELQRLHGELILAGNADATKSAERCFKRALQRARRQQAKALELRAACSLARLWLVEGRGREAQVLLSLVYNTFSEGRDTPDLRDAQTLLTQLG